MAYKREEALLAAAQDLFLRQGFHATSMAEILEASGAARLSVYQIYGSKDALMTAAVTRHGESWRDAFLNCDEEGPLPGYQRLEAFFTLVAAWVDDAEFRGCLAMHALLELGAGHAAGQAAVAHFEEVLAYLEAEAHRARVAKPAVLARQWWALAQGAMAAAEAGARSAGRDARVAALLLLGGAMPETRR